MNKYRVYCEEHGWVEVISSAEPTKCPYNSEDLLREGSAVIIEENILFNDGTPLELNLDEYKRLRYYDIDKKTFELILSGFSFAGKTFSLSQDAQINILALNETRNDPAIIYPIHYTTIDNLDTYDIPDADTLHNMYLIALATKKSYLDSGNNLKDQVRSAIDQDSVDLIIDNR